MNEFNSFLDVLDYFFYRLYLFYSTRRFSDGFYENTAINLMYATCLAPCVIILAIFARHLGFVFHKYTIAHCVLLLILFVLHIPFDLRYNYNKSITKNDYQLFRDRWGKEDIVVRKRRGWLIVVIIVNNMIVIPVLCALL